MIESAVKSLRTVQSDVLSHPLVYRRADAEFSLSGIPGKTIFRTTNEYGSWVRTETRDFIFPEGVLNKEPEAGDVIVFNQKEYEVLAPSGESVWRWSDPYHTAIRVHTKYIGELQ